MKKTKTGHVHSAKKQTTWKQLTNDDRIRLESLIRAYYRGKSPNFSHLARELGVHRTTISREFERGKVVNKDSELREYYTYSAEVAKQDRMVKASNKGPRQKMTNHIAKALREYIIEKKFSPYAALEMLKRKGEFSYLPCPRTVYYAIDEGQIGIRREDLPYKPKAKKVRSKGSRMAYRNPKGRPISERPEAANLREEFGHWEIDLLMGGRGTSNAALLVMTDRYSRMELMKKISAATQAAVATGLNRLEKEYPQIFKHIKTITCDNGGEFLDHQTLEQSANKKGKRCEIYYARAYCASDRGSNENANRIIRRFIPKGADISKYTNKQIRKIQDWINALPRQILNGLNAHEKATQYMKRNIA